jgi:imidazolonepropionase
VTDAVLRFEGGVVVFAGTDTDFVRHFGEGPLPGETVLDGRGKTAVPGFVDAHTHLPWDGFREDEFNRRLKGETYAGIAASGGGIVATVAATRAASVETLAANVKGRLDRMLAHGTTFCEAKTGYGLDLPNEKKQLAAILAGAKGHAVGVAPTALPAHELPPERRGSPALRRRYVDECVNEILPALAEGGARFADVFCEEGVFSLAESAEILETGKSLGLVPRVHADELTPLGGASLAARVGAASADHLLYATDEGIADMAAAGVVATLLPGTSVFLRMNRYAPGTEDDHGGRAGRARDGLQPRLVLHGVAPGGRVLRVRRDGPHRGGDAHRDDPERRRLARRGRAPRHARGGKGRAMRSFSTARPSSTSSTTGASAS